MINVVGKVMLVPDVRHQMFVFASGMLEDGGFGFVQGPVVDSTAELVYVFASSDGSTACTGGAACAAVYQLGVNFSGGTAGTKVTVGASTVNGSGTAPTLTPAAAPPRRLFVGGVW